MRIHSLGILAAALTTTTAAAAGHVSATASSRTALMADNPFAAPSTLPFHLPPFDRIRDSDYRPAFAAGMAEQLRQAAANAHNSDPPAFANTLFALERSGRLLAPHETACSS